jgi:hypothetical protein
MKFSIYQGGGEIRVNQGENLVLYGEQVSGFSVLTDVYQGDKHILRSTLFELLSLVKIKYQDLPVFISVRKRNGMVTLNFDDHYLQIKYRFKKPHILLFKDGAQIGWFNFRKGLHFGDREYDGEINSDDDNTILLCLLLFLMRLNKIG